MGFLLLAAGLLGLLLQYTVKDRIPLLAVLFYAMPPLTIAMATLLSVGMLARRASWKWVLLSVAAAVLAMATWIRTDCAYHRSAPVASAAPAANLRIVLWNAGHPRNPTPIARAMKAGGGDVIVLLECGQGDGSRSLAWRSHLPNHVPFFLPGNATLLSAYPVTKVFSHAMGRRTFVHVCELSTPAGPVSLVVADLESNPFSNRGPLIARVYELAMSSPHPTIVLGDFNTPHTSAFFRDFRKSFQHAFERSGTGLIPTWPSLLPVLGLDHIWLSPDIVPARTRTLRTFHSDHAAVIADVKLLP